MHRSSDLPRAQGRPAPPAAAGRWLAGLLGLLLLTPAAAARRERLELHHTRIDLPGAPAVVLPADLDGDGHRDLVVALAYTEWDQLMVEESTEMDGIEGLVEVMTIVPALADRRELRLFLADPARPGRFRAVEHVLPLGTEVATLESGPDSARVVALTDEGVSALRFDPGSGRLSLEALFPFRSVLAGSGAFVPRLGLSHDLDGDGNRDLLLPGDEGALIALGHGRGLEPTGEVVSLPTQTFEARSRGAGTASQRFYPLPEVRDVTGDGLSDLVFAEFDDGELWHYVARNLGGGRFAEPAGPFGLRFECRQEEGDADDGAERDEPDCEGLPRMAFFGDVDGDGSAEYVTQQAFPTPDDAGLREEIRGAKRPPFRYAVHRSRADLSPEPDSYAGFDAIGYTFETGNSDIEEDDIRIPGGFQDLDGDGRQDLVALTLDFSVFQIMRVMATRTLSIGLDFHLYCQTPEGHFRAVPGLDLSGKFKIHLDDVRLSQLSLFDGDFDGDGRADFVQLGRGKKVTIHRGRAGCSYPAAPDLQIRLEDEPRNLSLVKIDDLDGDGLSDLYIVQPNRIDEPGITPPVRLDIYLSSGSEP
ncbi:MAG: hypothetical protein MI919_20910 [Holophagales bacterium]|nr:hypothetical protein [Holophagales bacterium]